MKPYILVLVFALALPVRALAQPQSEVMTLGALQRAAVAADDRTPQVGLLEAQSALRERNVLATRLPSVGFDAQTQYQSDAAKAPFTLPTGEPLFSAPHATTDFSFRVEQRLFDPTRDAQLALERAQLAESRSRVRSTIYSVNQQVANDFFTVCLLREQMNVLATTQEALLVRQVDASARRDAGVALDAEVTAFDAALVELMIESQDLESRIEASISRIRSLVREPSDRLSSVAFACDPPDVNSARGRLRGQDLTVLRPEFRALDDARERLARQQTLNAAQQKPRLSIFSRVGYGRPGLNFIGDRFDLYGTVGLQLQWRPDTWGVAAREREALEIQRQIVQSEKNALGLTFANADDQIRRNLDRLGADIELQRKVVTAREEIERVTAIRLQAGAITASDYIDRSAELKQARNRLAAMRVELAQTVADLFTLVGVENP